MLFNFSKITYIFLEYLKYEYKSNLIEIPFKFMAYFIAYLKLFLLRQSARALHAQRPLRAALVVAQAPLVAIIVLRILRTN